MDRTFLKQGAEAKLEKCTFYGKPCLVKERFKKKYRHAVLDKSLTTQRMKSEVRAMLRCRTNGKGLSQSYAVSPVKSKEMVGDSWTDLKVILGHKSTIIRWDPDLPIKANYSQTKRELFHYIFCLWSLIVSSRCHRLQMVKEADEVLLRKRPC